MSSLTGKLLLAAPAMEDPNFSRSVGLVIKHDDAGALGWVLNRPPGAAVREEERKRHERGRRRVG